MAELSKPGHLLIFTKGLQTYFLYLYIRKAKLDISPLVVLPGVQELAKEYLLQLEIKHFSEMKRITLEYPEVSDIGVIDVPIDIFVDSAKKFKKDLFSMCLRNLINGYTSIFPIREIGAVAKDYSFVNYKSDIETIIGDYICKSKNIIIEAPRRAGKTSLMYQLVKKTRERGYNSYYIDMERTTTPVQFAAKLLIALDDEDIGSALDKKRKEIELGKSFQSNYRAVIETKLGKIAGRQKVILAIDECSYLVEEMLKEENSFSKVTDFLKWFREIRIINSTIRFIFSGSIKIASFEKFLKIDNFFYDCVEFPLRPFDSGSSLNLVEGLFYSADIYPPDYVADTIIHLTTPNFPYFLQIVTDETIKYYRAFREFPDREKIEFIIDQEIIGTNCRRYLDQLLINLRRYNPDEARGAKAILTHLSGKEKETTNMLKEIYRLASGQTVNFAKVLDLLEYDFYIERKGSNYYFNNEMIKKWWRINFAVIGESQ